MKPSSQTITYNDHSIAVHRSEHKTSGSSDFHFNLILILKNPAGTALLNHADVTQHFHELSRTLGSAICIHGQTYSPYGLVFSLVLTRVPNATQWGAFMEMLYARIMSDLATS